MQANREPQLIARERFSDIRGKVFHFRNFNLPDIKRVYFIEPSLDAGFRGWHGHKFESKTFVCVSGSFEVSNVEVEDWENGSSSQPAWTWRLKADSGELLLVPAGFANGILPLEEGSRLMVMSNKLLEESLSDDFRFPENAFRRPAPQN